MPPKRRKAAKPVEVVETENFSDEEELPPCSSKAKVKRAGRPKKLKEEECDNGLEVDHTLDYVDEGATAAAGPKRKLRDRKDRPVAVQKAKAKAPKRYKFDEGTIPAAAADLISSFDSLPEFKLEEDQFQKRVSFADETPWALPGRPLPTSRIKSHDHWEQHLDEKLAEGGREWKSCAAPADEEREPSPVCSKKEESEDEQNEENSDEDEDDADEEELVETEGLVGRAIFRQKKRFS